jgi:hypothetical protein
MFNTILFGCRVKLIKLLSLVVWICFFSYLEWTNSLMCNNYLQTRFLHIVVCICFNLKKHFVLGSILTKGWLFILVFFLIVMAILFQNQTPSN